MRKITAVGFVLALAVGVIVTSGNALAAKPSPHTPLTDLRSFVFAFKMSIGSANQTVDGSSFGIETSGVYAGPQGRQCDVKVKIGAGAVATRGVVVMGTRTWIDNGSGPRARDGSAFEFASLCASDPKFWNDHTLSVPKSLSGVPDTVHGIRADRFELGTIVAALGDRGIGFGLPEGMKVDRFVVWRSAHGGWTAGIDLLASIDTDDACSHALGDVGIALKAPCTFSLTFDMSRANDRALRVDVPKGATTRS